MAAYEYWHVEVQYSSGVWTDITPDVDSVRAPVVVNTGSSAEVSGDPASLTLTLKNQGFKYTPGNAFSSFALTSAQPIRFYEVFNEVRYYTFTGFIEFPEIDAVNMSMTQDQNIQIAAVDQLSRWERSETLVSTLAEHIMYVGGPELLGYWTFCDEAAPFRDLTGNQVAFVPVLNYPSTWFQATAKPTFQYQGGVGAPGDELVPITFTPSSDVYAYAWELMTQNNQVLTGSFGNGQFLTIVFWVTLANPPTGVNFDPILQLAFFNGADVNLMQFQRTSTGFSLTLSGGTMSATITTTGSPFNTPIPIGIQVGIGPNSLKLWVGDVETTATPTGSPSSPQSLVAQAPIIGWVGGSIYHFQLYAGTTYNRTKFLAQRAVGNMGNERQTTGERIRMLAQYAGKAEAELGQIDTGTSLMQRARLAGKTIAEAMYEARDTEQGDLFVDGNGLLNFEDRRTLYNI